MKRILALFLLLLMSAACAESAPLPYAIESGFLIFPAEDGKQPVPIAVKDGFAAKAQELAAENAYLGTPMNLPEALLPYVSDELTGGEELVEIYATEAVIVMHTRSAADGDVLRWAELDGGQYAVYRKIIGTDFWLQTSNAAGNLAEIFIEGEHYAECRVTLKDGKMLLHSVWGGQVYFIIEPHAICNDGTLTTCMSDGYVYGNHPYSDVTDLPFAEFPTTYEEAVQHLDRTNWAVVNNPNPADRLYLRGKASKEGRNLGKFYNRTPVYVEEIRGDWAYVRIGRATTGYMLTKYLAFGEDADKVECAFPQLEVREEYRLNVADETTYEFEVLDEPKKSAPYTRWHSGDNWVVIGIKGNYYIVMNDNESVCYIPQSHLWAGNG